MSWELLGVNLEIVSVNHMGTVPEDNLGNACGGPANRIWCTWELVRQDLGTLTDDFLATGWPGPGIFTL